MAMATLPSDCPFALEPFSIAEADHLARAAGSPVLQSGPLFRPMFPQPGIDFSEQQKDEIIRWHAEGVKDAIIGGRTCLRKLRHGDGTLVGLAGWVMERCREEQANPSENKTAAEAAKVSNDRRRRYVQYQYANSR
jgi:hypothetical protein